MVLARKHWPISLGLGLPLFANPVSSNVLQYFAGISYSNPAELFKVQKNTLIIGSSAFDIQGKFWGTALDFTNFQYPYGVSRTNQTSFLPYGRIAHRVNDKIVLGVDITQPFHSNLRWGKEAVTRFAGIDNLMTDVDVSPRVSIMVSPGFWVGGGFNFNFLKSNITSWMLPNGQSGVTELINPSSSFGLGANAGLFKAINQSNFLGLTYYSAIPQDTAGTSTFGANYNGNYRFRFYMPATTVLNYVHLFNPSWLISAQGFVTQWNANQFARLRNTAAPPPANPDFNFEMRYKASTALALALRHQWNEKLGLTLLGILDDGPERDHLRTILFPADKQYLLALNADYKISKSTTIEAFYGRGYSKTLLGNTINLGGQNFEFIQGRVRMQANVFDLRVKVEV